jgi:hypothetical protein
MQRGYIQRLQGMGGKTALLEKTVRPGAPSASCMTDCGGAPVPAVATVLRKDGLAPRRAARNARSPPIPGWTRV